MSELILYPSEDRRSQIKLRADQQTVWLTQLDPAAAVKQSLTAQFSTFRTANGFCAIAGMVAEDSSVVNERRGACS